MTDCYIYSQWKQQKMCKFIKDSVRGWRMVGVEKGPRYLSMQLFSIIQGIHWNIQANSGQTCTHSCQHWNRNKCTKCISLKYSIWLFFFLIFWICGNYCINVYKNLCVRIYIVEQNLQSKWNICFTAWSTYRLKPLSRIRIRDSVLFRPLDRGSGSGMKENPDPDPEWKNSDPGSGINIPDPQHWLKRKTTTTQNWQMKARYVQSKICSREQEYEQKCLTKLLLSK